MKLTKIKRKDDQLTLVWLEEQQEGQTTHKHELVSKEDPEPEFFTALNALAPHVLALLELPIDYGGYQQTEKLIVQGVSLSYDKDGYRKAVVTCLRLLHGADAPLVLNTPQLLDWVADTEDACLTYNFGAAIDEVCDRAERFINGARAQRDLFAEKVSEELAAQLI